MSGAPQRLPFLIIYTLVPLTAWSIRARVRPLPRVTRGRRLARWAVAGLALQACSDATLPTGQSGPAETGPRAGQYFVGEFEYQNDCRQPPYALTGSRATARTAVFDLRPETPWEGTVGLTGSFSVPDPTPGAPAVAIFEGPDAGRYLIAGDTLRLGFAQRTNEWVGVLRFTRFTGGVLAGTSGTRCSSMMLRLERQP